MHYLSGFESTEKKRPDGTSLLDETIVLVGTEWEMLAVTERRLADTCRGRWIRSR